MSRSEVRGPRNSTQRHPSGRRPLGSRPLHHHGSLLDRKYLQPLRSQRALPIPHPTPHRDPPAGGHHTSEFANHRWFTGHGRFTLCREPDAAQAPIAEGERCSGVNAAHAFRFLPSPKAWCDSNELDARNQLRERSRVSRHVPDQSHIPRTVGQAQERGDLHRRRRRRGLEVRGLVPGAPGWGPQIAETPSDREAVATVRAPQRSLDHPPVLQEVGDEDQAEPRPTAGTDQPVGEQKMHGEDGSVGSKARVTEREDCGRSCRDAETRRASSGLRETTPAWPR